MNVNFRWIHYLVLVCGALTTSLPTLTKSLPPTASPWILAIAAICGVLTTVLGVVSPPAMVSGNDTNAKGRSS